jgi:ATP-dependent DNA ligase
MTKTQLKKGSYLWIINFQKEKELYQIQRGKENGKLVSGIWQEGDSKKIERLILQKRKLGYSESGELSNEFICMLAENIKTKTPNYPVIAEFKYDGARLLYTKEGMFTKNSIGALSKKIDYLPQLESQLKIVRNLLVRYLKRDDIILDGELYNHDIGFQGVLKILKFNPNTADEEQIRFVENNSQFYWYDIAIEGLDLLERIGIRNKVHKYFSNRFFHDRIINVPNRVVNNQSEADVFKEIAVEQGFEGLVLKDSKGYYEHRRSPMMIKYKKSEDMEVTIIDVLEGNGERKGIMGRLIVEYYHNGQRILQDIDLRSNEGVKVDRNLLESILANKDSYIGNKLTVEYMELTTKGQMKLGKGLINTIKAVRDYE